MPESLCPQDGALLTYRDAARELNTSIVTVRRMVKGGRLRAIRMSATLVRLRREDIQKLIEEARA